MFMKKRIYRVLNFLAFNLLFFSLYLNFVHRDKDSQQPVKTVVTPAQSQGTVLVNNPDEYINKAKNKQAAENMTQPDSKTAKL
jgi:hypothetical protein